MDSPLLHGDSPALRTILIVEDEQASREGLLVLLARAGYRTIGAGTLKEARQILERIPAGRWGDPGDLGGAAVFLASSASDYVNGHVLAVDGGWLAR